MELNHLYQTKVISTVPCKESSIANSVNEISASIENFVKDIEHSKHSLMRALNTTEILSKKKLLV